MGRASCHLLTAHRRSWNPSQNDVVVYEKTAALAHAPDAKKFPHVARWFKHIQSWSVDERKAYVSSLALLARSDRSLSSWHAGVASAATPGAPAAAAAEPAKKKDDDFDLFGEEDDAEHEKILEQRRKEHEEKKKASGKVVIAKSSVILEVKPWDDTTGMFHSHLIHIAGFGRVQTPLLCKLRCSRIGSDFRLNRHGQDAGCRPHY